MPETDKLMGDFWGGLAAMLVALPSANRAVGAAAVVAEAVAIGEIGLDGHWVPEALWPRQEEVFRALVAIALVYMTISVHHFVTVERERRRTREAFSRYLNPELARLVSENPEMLQLGGKRVPLLNFSGGTEMMGILACCLLRPLKPCAFNTAVPGTGASVCNGFIFCQISPSTRLMTVVF